MSFQTRSRKNKKKKVDLERIAFLAIPNNRSPYFMPDRPSIYWLDYILDETHLKITNPTELYNYYDKFFSKSPRLKELSRPKTVIDECPVTRPTTAYGVPLSALYYEPTERIKLLSTPKFARITTAASFPVSDVSTGRRSTTSSKVRIGDARSASSLQSSKRVRSTSGTRQDLGRGDFYRRSQYRLQDRSSSRESGAPPMSMRNRPPMSPNRETRIGEGLHNRRNRLRVTKGNSGTPISSRSPTNKPKAAKSAPDVQLFTAARPPVPNPNSSSSTSDIRGNARHKGKPNTSRGSMSSRTRGSGSIHNTNNKDNKIIASTSEDSSQNRFMNNGRGIQAPMTSRDNQTETDGQRGITTAPATRNSSRDKTTAIKKRPPFK